MVVNVVCYVMLSRITHDKRSNHQQSVCLDVWLTVYLSVSTSLPLSGCWISNYNYIKCALGNLAIVHSTRSIVLFRVNHTDITTYTSRGRKKQSVRDTKEANRWKSRPMLVRGQT